MAFTPLFQDLWMIKKYEKKKDDFSINERSVNALGYQYIAGEKFKSAILLFKLNVREFPKSANVYDSLGEAFMLNGDKELAIKNYQKALELNPGLDSAKKCWQNWVWKQMRTLARKSSSGRKYSTDMSANTSYSRDLSLPYLWKTAT